MGGNSESAKRAAATLKMKYGADYFASLAKSRKKDSKRGGGFKDMTPDRLKEVSSRGGKSKREENV